VLSGWLLALAGSLQPSWMAAWIGSVPVLVAAFTATARGAWLLGLIAGLIGGSSIFGYYATVAGDAAAVSITVLKALLYAGGIRLAVGVRRRLPAWIAVCAFPAWFAAFDTLIAAFSANGTAGSPAYSQMNFPLALQVAAFGGAPAVTFLVFLFSSTLAHAIVATESPARAAGRLARVRPSLSVAPDAGSATQGRAHGSAVETPKITAGAAPALLAWSWPRPGTSVWTAGFAGAWPCCGRLREDSRCCAPPATAI